MGYTKLIKYANIIELYQYEKDIDLQRFNRSRVQRGSSTLKGLGNTRKNMLRQEKPLKPKRFDNARRSAMVFKRLVSANLGECENPLLVSLTYSENVVSIGQGHKDFKAFTRRFTRTFGKHVRYISVCEFQKRGAIHFHALFWGVDSKRLSDSERSSRMVANLWRCGFVDLVATDGSHKISSYLAKYMVKAFLDPRLSGKKAYICSHNIKRPVVEKNAWLSPYFYDVQGYPDLSTVTPSNDVEYMTKWLGKGRYRLFNLK